MPDIRDSVSRIAAFLAATAQHECDLGIPFYGGQKWTCGNDSCGALWRVHEAPDGPMWVREG